MSASLRLMLVLGLGLGLMLGSACTSAPSAPPLVLVPAQAPYPPGSLAPLLVSGPLAPPVYPEPAGAPGGRLRVAGGAGGYG